MIDTSKCKTREEIYDAMEAEHISVSMQALQMRLGKLETFKRKIERDIEKTEQELNKLDSYMSIYKQTYPNRPWEDVSIE